MSVLLLTRSLWSEPPRLRTQVAELLLDSHHKVFFAERPSVLGTSEFMEGQRVRVISDQLTLLSQKELLHHQLRILPTLHHFNAAFSSRMLHHVLAKLPANGSQQFQHVINFNYDAFWLRRLFPDLPITTIINDDFEALGRLPFHGHLTWALSRTCAMSDRVMAVSQPLLDRLALWSNPELFLPWSNKPYFAPSGQKKRNVVLFWGFINDRIDAEAILHALPLIAQAGFKLRFVGPVQSSGVQLRKRLHSHPAIDWQDTCCFADLDTSDCFAAIIPYRLNCPGVEAIQLSNKALQLLSCGLPLIISSMPHFHRADYVLAYGSTTYPRLINAIHAAASHFEAFQPAIESFVAANGPQQRLAQLLSSGCGD